MITEKSLQAKIKRIDSINDLNEDEKQILLKSYKSLTQRFQLMTSVNVESPDDRDRIKTITNAICRVTDIPFEMMQSARRDRPIVFARQLCMYVIKFHTRQTLKAIGEMFNRDHTTVIHAINTINDLMEFDETIKNQVENILSVFHKEEEIAA